MNGEPSDVSITQAWLRLCRVSNLPTVWTNAYTAAALGASSVGGGVPLPAILCLMVSMSLFYVGGMILNDAFDADYDAKFRSNRPIPSGLIGKRLAFGVGFGLLAVGVASVTILGGVTLSWLPSLMSSLALSATIVAYDAYHKGNPASPILMGLCRALIYVTVGLSLGALGDAVLVASGLQCAYVLGLTYAAKQEDLASPGSWWPLALLLAVVGYVALVMLREPMEEHWPLVIATAVAYLAWVSFATRPLFQAKRNIGESVGRLIAGVAAVDALLLSLTGSAVAVALALLALVLTRYLHRVVPGT